jgi:hypothetical protein
VTTGLLLRISGLAGSSMIRRLRRISGLVMLAYVTMHLLNHAVGLRVGALRAVAEENIAAANI